jgi:hypothetical protein
MTPDKSSSDTRHDEDQASDQVPTSTKHSY